MITLWMRFDNYCAALFASNVCLPSVPSQKVPAANRKVRHDT